MFVIYPFKRRAKSNLLALLGAQYILHISGIGVNSHNWGVKNRIFDGVSDLVYVESVWTPIVQSIQRLTTGLTVRDRMPMRARFFAHVHTGSGAHSASRTTGSGSLSRGYIGRGVTLTIHPHIRPRLKNEYFWAVMASCGLNFTFAFRQIL